MSLSTQTCPTLGSIRLEEAQCKFRTRDLYEWFIFLLKHMWHIINWFVILIELLRSAAQYPKPRHRNLKHHKRLRRRKWRLTTRTAVRRPIRKNEGPPTIYNTIMVSFLCIIHNIYSWWLKLIFLSNFISYVFFLLLLRLYVGVVVPN